MPWKASSVMEERLRFVARLLDGEAMTDVCQEFGISRKTGYKIFDRYKEHGLEALTDRSRRPVRYANQLPQQIAGLIVRLKAEKPHWGARKIRELLVRRLDGDVRVPAKSTIHAVLDRHGLVKRGGGARHRARGTPLSQGLSPNDLWCADFKGEFKLGNGRYCFPLTVSDHAARFLLLCEALDSTREDPAITAFVREFNTERPHEALGMQCPAEVYTASVRAYTGLPDLSYPFHDRDVVVTACGRLCLHRKKINISTVLAGQKLGIKEVDEGIWLASFMQYDLGYFDLEQKTLQPLDNPFGTRLSPMS